MKSYKVSNLAMFYLQQQGLPSKYAMHQIIFKPVLFPLSILSEYGTILKALSTANKSLHGCYLEELRILPEGQIGPIKSLQILQSDRSLFVGLDDRLLKIPLERCSSYPTERYDPYQSYQEPPVT